MTAPPLVSVVIPVLNEGRHLTRTVDSLFRSHTSVPFECIVVDDGSTDGCCDGLQQFDGKHRDIKLLRASRTGVAKARNAGATAGAGSFIVFCDAHLFFRDRWLDRLIEPLARGRADAACPAIADSRQRERIGYGQTLDESMRVRWNPKRGVPFQTAVLPGGCLAVTKAAYSTVGGFDAGFTGWGYEEVDFSLRMWLFGYRCIVQPAVTVRHVFRQTFPYEVDANGVHANLLRMAYSHFSEERIAACKALIGEPTVTEITAEVEKNGALEQRESFLAKRIYGDDWYMERFGIPF